MSTTVIVVIDGFGVGAMPDAGALRPGDLTADTCGHVLDHCRASLGGRSGCPRSARWVSASSIRTLIWPAGPAAPSPSAGPHSATPGRTPSPGIRP